jgi:hypothetical protein
MSTNGVFRRLLILGALFSLAPASVSVATAEEPVVRQRTTSDPAEPSHNELSSSLRLVFVHGFGGKEEQPPFVENLKRFAVGLEYPLTIETYSWDSVELDYSVAGYNWTIATQKALGEAARFKSDVLDKLERKRKPYVLVGYSLGARVIAEALDRRDRPLSFVRGIYFMGAAMGADFRLKRSVLPPGMKVVNYHSPTYDQALKIGFYFMAGKRAGGEIGFEDDGTFVNYPVACTHENKGAGIHCDYSQLAVPVGYLCLRTQGVDMPGETRLNVRTRVGEGETWWNDIVTFADVQLGEEKVTITIQQHKANADHFRAVSQASPDAPRYREAWGNNLHAILAELGL